MKSQPTLEEEQKLWGQGHHLVIGVDEVGRGALAGPVVAAACAFTKRVLDDSLEKIGINDSKQIKPQRRKKLALLIKEKAKEYAVSSVNVATINKVGIAKATAIAMRQAIQKVRGGRRCFVLVDAFYIRHLRGVGKKKQKGIVDGDQKSISIAAASILAKVHRDSFMQKLAKKYPHYGWGRNKGYGTREHQEAIRRYGITRHHRKAFVQTTLNLKERVQS